MTLLALAFALGIACGWQTDQARVWPFLLAGAVLVMISAAAHITSRQAAAFITLLGAMTCLGAGWVVLRHEYAAEHDLAAMIGDEATLVRIEGVATRGPETRYRTAGSMAIFDYRPPATYFPMRVDRLLPHNADPIEVRGAVLVRVDQTLPPFHAGDRVKVTGFLLRPALPRNPGEFDFRRYAKSLGQAGILTVRGRDAVEITPANRGAIMSTLLDWRDRMRHRSNVWLLAHLPESERQARDALLVSLMLGQRDAQIDDVHESFRRVGLAHILAISGFHMAVLAGFVLLVARSLGCSRRVCGIMVIAAVLVYLVLVEPRMPVLRAGIMAIVASLGMLLGRRLHVGGLISLSAIMLLLWRPDQLFNVGFQLSYGVVLALVTLSNPLRARWFGRPDLEAATSMQMLGEMAKNAVAVAVIAWVTALPITLYHFGTVAALGIPMSLLAVPIASIMLSIGFMKIVAGAVFPPVATLLGFPLTALAELMLILVNLAEQVPWATLHVPHPSVAWTLLALAWAYWWGSSRRFESKRRMRFKHAALIVLIAWLCWPLMPQWLRPNEPHELLRIDMLAVGDGSCYILRSGGETMVFDAGSSTDLNAGRRSIIPAMRRLGVRNVDRICITHANLDHYSAVIEIADEFSVGEICITPQHAAVAEADPLSATTYLFDQLSQRRVRVNTISEGEQWMLGECVVECLHPPPGQSFTRENDASLVLRISAGKRSVLMTGDIQAAAMATLMTPGVNLQSDVLELPHHGSFNDVAVGFVERVRPSIVMQSTGWSRWQSDRWHDHLSGAERLVTVRDGACTVVLDSSGEMRVQRFLSPGVHAGLAEVE